MTGTNAAATAKEPEPTSTATAGLTAVTPDLIQQLLEHDYLKLKIKAQVDELTNAKLTRWRTGLFAAASAAVVVLGYLGIQANQIVNDFNQKAEKIHTLQDQIHAAQARVESASTRVDDLVQQAKANADRGTGLVVSSQGFLLENIKEVQNVKKVADDVNSKLNDSKQQLSRAIEESQQQLATKVKEADAVLKEADPYIKTMKAAKDAAEEARKAGTFDIVFLESNGNRTILLSDYSNPATEYRVKFTTNHIKARANVDVEATVDGQKFPVQHLGNLTVGEVQAIEHTSLRIEVSALRHHRQPFLHSFLILRVFSAKQTQSLVAEKKALANADTNQE
jgi:division protein CdvB (Snf7/Vps24/ESCRT-III family)